MLPDALRDRHDPATDVLVAIPLKGFAAAKARLAGVLDPASRERLGRSLAARTASTVSATGAEPVIVTADPDVAGWAAGEGLRTVAEPAGTGLSGAAGAAAAAAARTGRPWFILHADLPWLRAQELSGALAHVAAGRYVLCPSYDGGTTGFGGGAPVPFRYGPASFHRHLALVSRSPHHIYVSAGFALDIDSADDLTRLRDH